MPKTDIANELAQTDKEKAAEIKKIEEKFEKKKEQILAKQFDDFSDALGAAWECYKLIPKEFQGKVWKIKPALVKILNGLLPFNAGKERRSRISNDEILTFISTEKTTSEIMEHFRCSAVTAAKRLNDLVKAGKASVRKEGTSKYWKKA